MEFDYLLIVCTICAVVVLILCINYWIANRFYEVACMKGHKEFKYFWAAFLFGIVGYILIAILPDRNNHY